MNDSLDELTQQILQLHAEGLTFRQIGPTVGVSYETARKIVGRYRDTARRPPTPPSVEEDGSCWMTPAEAAEALGMRLAGMRSRMYQGRIEAKRMGCRWFVRVYDSEWVDSNGVPPKVKRMAELRSQGLPYSKIAQAVGLSAGAVHWHLKRWGIMERMKRPRVEKGD